MSSLTIKGFRAGVVALAVVVGAFLLFAPAGRALVFVLVGIAPDTPRTTVEAWLRGSGYETEFACYSINVTPGGGGRTNYDDLHEQLRAVRRGYTGPLYLAEIQYAGCRRERVVRTHLQPDLSTVAVLFWLALSATPMVAAQAHRTWRLRRARHSAPIPTNGELT